MQWVHASFLSAVCFAAGGSREGRGRMRRFFSARWLAANLLLPHLGDECRLADGVAEHVGGLVGGRCDCDFESEVVIE